MNSLHAPTPRRHYLSVILRSVAMPIAAAMALTAIGRLSAEAAPIRTTFQFASPNARAGKLIRNGERISLEVTLSDGKKGIPGQVITFEVTVNKKVIDTAKAVTDVNGRANVTRRIKVPGLTGRNWVPASWKPTFEGNGNYGRPQNNNLNGGFRVLP